MPRYAETLLTDGERIVLRSRQHWLATFVDGRVAWALFVASLVLIMLRLQMHGDGTVESAIGIAILVLLVVSIVMLAKLYWSWYAEDYIVTNRRVLKVEGILNKRSADSSLEKINDAVLEQNLFGRLFGYGDLDILTAAEDSVDRYRMLDQAPRFKKAMLEAKHRLETEMVRLPSPPSRSGAATSPRFMAPDDVARALASLAELRDSGAITLEDFESKKGELLSRL